MTFDLWWFAELWLFFCFFSCRCSWTLTRAHRLQILTCSTWEPWEKVTRCTTCCAAKGRRRCCSSTRILFLLLSRSVTDYCGKTVRDDSQLVFVCLNIGFIIYFCSCLPLIIVVLFVMDKFYHNPFASYVANSSKHLNFKLKSEHSIHWKEALLLTEAHRHVFAKSILQTKGPEMS